MIYFGKKELKTPGTFKKVGDSNTLESSEHTLIEFFQGEIFLYFTNIHHNNKMKIFM